MTDNDNPISRDEVCDILTEHYQAEKEDLCDLYIHAITTEEVTEAITSLNSSKSPGPSSLIPAVTKNCIEEITQIMTKILTNILDHNYIPSCWKIAYLTPIPKKGEKISLIIL